MHMKIGNHLREVMRGKKAGRSWESILGYTAEQLFDHLKQQLPKRHSMDRRSRSKSSQRGAPHACMKSQSNSPRGKLYKHTPTLLFIAPTECVLDGCPAAIIGLKIIDANGHSFLIN
jgi:hypothetical protein